MRRKFIVGVVLLTGWFILTKGIFVSLYDLAIHDEGHSHLLVVPFLALFFLYFDKDRIFKADRTNPLLRKILLILFSTAGGMLFISKWAQIQAELYSQNLTVLTASAILLLFALFLSLNTKVDLSAAFFPALLLLLMVPIPGGARESIVTFLVKGTAAITDILFHLTGTTFYREGNVFLLPGLTIEIANVCSGIRSSIGLFITVLLAGHLFYKKAWTKTALVALVLPLAVMKNAIRIAGLTLLSLYIDPAFLEGKLHHVYGGMVFFTLTLVIFLFPLLLLFHKLEGGEKRQSV